MFTKNFDHRSGLYDVWVYFPRTLISDASKLIGRNDGNLSDDHALGYKPEQCSISRKFQMPQAFLTMQWYQGLSLNGRPSVQEFC